MKKLSIILALALLAGCSNAPQDKLHLLSEEDVVVELGSDLDLTLDKYIDTSDLNEEDLDNVTIKLVAAITNGNGEIDTDAKELETTALGFGSKAIVITLNDEAETIKVVVEDTTAPEFTKSKDKYEITEGDDLPNIKKDFEAKDLSDDVTILVDSENVKTDKAGEYKATVKAVDASGNETSKEVTVTVKEKPKQTVSTNTGSSSKPSGNSGSSSKPSSGGSSSSKPSSGGSSSSKPSGSGSSGSSSGGSTSKPSQTEPIALLNSSFKNYPSMSACKIASNDYWEYAGKFVDAVACQERPNGSADLELHHYLPDGSIEVYSTNLGGWVPMSSV